MLKLARLIPSPRAQIDFNEYVPVAIDWPSGRTTSPWYWRITNDYELLMLGLDPVSGALLSIENPARARVVRTQERLWPERCPREGHPVFDLRGVPLEDTYHDATDVASFEFRHSPSAIRIAWGAEAEVVADGRVRFGFDAAQNLVSVGLDGLSSEEARSVEGVLARTNESRGRTSGS